MASKFMTKTRIVIPFLSAVILISQLTGCAIMSQDELLNRMDNSEEIIIEVPTLVETGKATDIVVDGHSFTTEAEDEAGIIEEVSTEMSQEELYELFEEVYEESLMGLRNYMGVPFDILLSGEITNIEFNKPVGKELPSDYKEQYKAWRSEHKIKNMNCIFTPTDQVMYANGAISAYDNIYKDTVLERLEQDQVVRVTGIGYDKATNWYQIETSSGKAYVMSNELVTYIGQGLEYQFNDVSKTMYANGTVNIREEPDASSKKLGSLNRGDAVKVTGIGREDAAGWIRIELNGDEVYVSAKYLSDSKPSAQTTQNTNNSGGQQNSGGGQGNPGGSQNNGGGYNGTGLTLQQISELPDSQKQALGFTQLSNGAWVDSDGMRLPSPELTQEQIQADRDRIEDAGIILGSG